MPPSCAVLDGFAIGARVALLWQHCGNAWQSPVVICQAHRMHAAHAHYACRWRLTPLIGDNIDTPAACTVLFRPYCGGVVTRTWNVSEYMFVLALCLVSVSCGLWALLLKLAHSFPARRDRHNQPGKAVQKLATILVYFPKWLSFKIYENLYWIQFSLISFEFLGLTWLKVYDKISLNLLQAS